MRWQIKCLIDNAKGILPFQDRLRDWKRRMLGYQANTRNDPGTLADGLKQVKWLTGYLGTLKGLSVLEIGSGWEPIIPLVYRLAGARVVYLTDSTKLLCDQSLDAALDFLAESRNQICAALQISQSHFDNVLTQAREGKGTMESRLNSLEIVYLAPCDCRSLPLDSRSLDIVFSRAVLEHIPKSVIHEIFRESKRLLKPEGAMCHFIDNSDHWEHRDKSISRINFLQHGDLLWRLTCVNSLNYQNRLRHQDYLDMLREEGFQVVQAEREIDEKSLQLLPKLRLASQFREKPHEDLAVISSYLLASTAK